MKNFNWIVVAALSLGVVAADLSAQDSRERNYYYEISCDAGGWHGR